MEEWGATDLPALGGGMMSWGGSSLDGILETEKVKRERFVNTVTIHWPDYKATHKHSKLNIDCEDRQEGGREEQGGPRPNERGYISR